MKVSPEYFIQLSHRVNTLHSEKEKFIESPGKIKDRKVIESPSEKGTRKHCKPGSKDRVDIFICILTSPGQEIGHTTRESSHLKLEITQAFSIVDRKFRQKPTTTTTSCNGWKKVRKQKVRYQVRIQQRIQWYDLKSQYNRS